MQLVALAKRRRCIDQMLTGRPYAQAIERIARHMILAHSEFQHPLLAVRDGERAGYFVVTSDRGLCGGLNHRLLTRVARLMSAHPPGSEQSPRLGVFGQRGIAFFRNRGEPLLACTPGVAHSPSLSALTGTTKVLIDEYADGRIDRLFLAFNRFDNALRQTPTIVPLLPIPPAEDPEVPKSWDYLYEPESLDLIDAVLRRYLECQIYQALLENRACEMTARATAMQQASDNASQKLKELNQTRHKLRQAAITQEIEEIMSGCEATRE